MTLKMLGLNEEFRAVFAYREFIHLQSFAISRSVAEAREEVLIAANDTAVAAKLPLPYLCNARSEYTRFLRSLSFI